jgi:hypothetical protein
MTTGMTSDDIGDRGEAAFRSAILRLHGRQRPFFRAHFLGEKYETLDFLVALPEPRAGAPFFFVQVKSTTRPAFRNKHGIPHLRAAVPLKDYEALVSYPAPTYIVGIEDATERAYLISANEPRRSGLGSISMQFPLDGANMQLLWDEVHDYWAAQPLTVLNSQFAI